MNKLVKSIFAIATSLLVVTPLAHEPVASAEQVTVTGGCDRQERTTHVDLPKDGKTPMVHKLGVPGDIWRSGDCSLGTARLTIYPDGRVQFRSDVKTDFTHTKDVWHQYWEAKKGTTVTWRHQENSEELSEKDNPQWHKFDRDWTADYRLSTDIKWVGCC